MKILYNGKTIKKMILKDRKDRPVTIVDKDFEVDKNRWDIEQLRKRATIIGYNTVKIDDNVIEFKPSLLDKIIFFKDNSEFTLLKMSVNLVDFYNISV